MLRNDKQHPDLTDEDKINALLSLYEYEFVFQDKRKTGYYHFVRKNNDINYVVLLDTCENKTNFEVVHYLSQN